MKKQYMTPELEVVRIEGANLLAGSPTGTVSGTASTGYGGASELDVDDDW